jgi:predicted transcriptional regulator
MNKDKKGKSLSIEQKTKISLGNKNKVVSQEIRKRISETLKSKNLTSAVAMIVEKYSLDNILLEKYNSMIRAELENGYGSNSLRYHILTKGKTEHDGFIWKIIRQSMEKNKLNLR